MALRNIITKEDPSLYKTSRVVEKFDARLHTLLDDMKETLLASGGVGLAAPQVGVLKRVCLVMETNVEEGQEEYVIELINPEIEDPLRSKSKPRTETATSSKLQARA